VAYSELALLLDMNDRIFSTVSELETLFSIKIAKVNVKTNITSKDDSWQPLSPGAKNRRPRGNTEPYLVSPGLSDGSALRISIRQGSNGPRAEIGTPSEMSTGSSPSIHTPPVEAAWRHRAVHIRLDHPPLPSLVRILIARLLLSSSQILFLSRTKSW
jgi:hypothetical protein